VTLHKLTAGEVLAGLAALALAVALFGPWFDGESAFGAFTVVLVLLVLVALLGAALLITTAFQRSQAYPVAAEVFGFVLAAITTIVILIEVAVRDERGWGAWLGLAGVVGVAAGCWAALRSHTRP
jgi:ABC-type transport system involved in multi-copper enzyme maturation permease subunit